MLNILIWRKMLNFQTEDTVKESIQRQDTVLPKYTAK